MKKKRDLIRDLLSKVRRNLSRKAAIRTIRTTEEPVIEMTTPRSRAEAMIRTRKEITARTGARRAVREVALRAVRSIRKRRRRGQGRPRRSIRLRRRC